MSPESASNARLDAQSPLERMARRIELLYGHAKRLLDGHRHHMPSFTDLYSPEKVMEDFQEVKRRQAKAQAQDDMKPHAEAMKIEAVRKLSTICEAAFFRGVKEERWLGKDAHVSATSPFDNWVNGIDLAVEFRKDAGSSYLGLGIDVTFASQMDEKFRRIKSEIDAGYLAKVRYFKSADESFRGELSMVPRVVVGIDGRRLEQLISRWNNDSRSPLTEPLIHDSLLEEIRMQLVAFRDYARRTGREQIATAYGRDLGVLEEILREQPISTDLQELSKDRVFEAIRRNLEMFSSGPRQ